MEKTSITKTTVSWDTINWAKVQRRVFKVQKKIFQAVKSGDKVKARKLQKLLSKSFYAKLLAVRKVTQDNSGKKTAGVDGVKIIHPQQRYKLAMSLKVNVYKSKPLRRVWIPKPGKDEKRPLGIPTIHDRAMQCLVKFCMEPYWEAQFEGTSYGFRPGRSAHDAIEAIFNHIKSVPKYILDADIAKCFDRIDHRYLIEKIDNRYFRPIIKQWLKAGVMNKGVFEETECGTPQGGVISPLLANIALDGMIRDIQSTFPKSITRNGKHPETLHPRFTKAFILESLELILKNNIFYFDGVYYIQNTGTAMGTRAAPPYATLSVGYFEHKMYIRVQIQFSNDLAEYLRKYWRRFLDDIWTYWLKKFGDFMTFFNMLNGLHPSITFTIEQSETEIPFLNILIRKNDNAVTTDIYYKKTDTKNYLPFKSYHPRHTKVNIPFCLARMICTIVDDPDIKKQRLTELKLNLRKKHYPINIIDNGINKAMSINQTDLRSTKIRTNDEKNVIPFVHTHSPSNGVISTVIDHSLNILKTDDHMKEIISNSKIVKSRRQPPNLGRLLCRSRFDQNQPTNEISKCSDSRCRCCDHIITGNTHQLKSGTVLKPNSDMSCDSMNLIYVIECLGCREHYVGETGQTLRERMRGHRVEVTNAQHRKTPVDIHIAKCSKKHPFFNVFPVYKCHPKGTMLQRRAREDFLIKKLHAKLNMLRI